MKITRYSEPQIFAILRQAKVSVPLSELCGEQGMCNASLYKWQSKYGCMNASMISQMKALEDENWRLKKMYAGMSMQAEFLKEALGKSDPTSPAAEASQESDSAPWGQHCAGLPHVRCQ